MSAANTSTKQISIAEMALELRLAPSTVSRALREHPSIAAETVKQVQDLAKKNGYKPRKELARRARTLHKHINGVAFVVDQSVVERLSQSLTFYTRIQWAVQNALRAQSTHLILSCAQRDMLTSGSLYCIEEGMADAAITKLVDDTVIARLAEHVPLVSIDHDCAVPGVDSVISNAGGTARTQLNYLHRMGHRAIACFRPNVDSLNGSGGDRDLEFWREYIAHSRRLGLSIPPAWLEPIQFDEKTESRAVREFLDRILSNGNPTAIVTYDSYAPTLIDALAERELSVPRDISIFGFDDDLHGRHCPIKLTTLRQDVERIASEAVRLLVERIRDPERPSLLLKVDGRVIERDSTAPPAKITQSFPSNRTPTLQS